MQTSSIHPHPARLATPTGLPRAIRRARPALRAVLLTTALAWSIGVPAPGAGTAAQSVSMSATIHALDTISSASPTPRSTRARQP